MKGEVSTLDINSVITSSYSSTLRWLQSDGKHCPPRLRKQRKWRDPSSLDWAIIFYFYSKHKFWLFKITSSCGYIPSQSRCSLGTANHPLQLQNDQSEHVISLSSHSDCMRCGHMTWAKQVSLHWEFSAKAVWEDGFLLWGFLRGCEVMTFSDHLPPPQGINLSVGENENNAEREGKEQRDEEIEYYLKMAEAWIQLCLKHIWTF